MVRPSALADLRLMTISTLVGSSTGNSPDLLPLKAEDAIGGKTEMAVRRRQGDG